MDQLAKKIKLFHDKNSDSCADNTSSSGYNDIKTPLWNVMRPHQKEAFQFLVSRLLGIANTKSSNINSYSNSSSSTNANCIDRNDSRNIFAVQSTGAVLADDMGTGKVMIRQ